MKTRVSRARPMRAGAASLWRDARGAIAVWFALVALLILVLTVGVIDLSRIQSTRTRLQDSLDAATLAAARMGPMDDDKLDKAGGDLLAAEFHDRTATLGARKFKNGPENSVIGSGEAILQPMVVGLVFPAGIKVAAESIVKRAQEAPVELALVLDTTGSMEGSRLTSLKAAATTLVSEMTPPGVTTVKLAVVPFGQYVNVGVSRRNEPWMNVPADSIGEKVCTTQTTTQQCSTRPATCTRNNDGVITQYACTEKYNCVTVPLNPPKQFCSTPTAKFHGCAGSPAYNRNVTDDDATRRYPGMMNVTCGSEITPLTSNAATVKAAVSKLAANGQTYIPGGLAWGFNLLSAPVPMTEGLAYDPTGKNIKPRKALVLMTDGANTLKMNAKGEHVSVGAAAPTQANTFTSELCANIKAKKIEVFTVAFEVTDSTIKTILKGCATDDAHYFDAKDTQALNAAFKNIAEALRSIYISK